MAIIEDFETFVSQLGKHQNLDMLRMIDRR
jgi:hypothetical protein